MKTTLFILCVIVTSCLSAQNIAVISQDKSVIISTCDSLASIANRGYFRYSETVKDVREGYYIILKYKSEKETTDILSFVVKRMMVGQNVDLERSGVPAYSFSTAVGKFLSLFPFWKHFIAPDSDPEYVSKRGRSGYVKYQGKMFILRKESDGIWLLEMR